MGQRQILPTVINAIQVKVDLPSNPSSPMAQASDWTERHRPFEQLLEGNEVQRRKIRAWLDEWQNGSPKKKPFSSSGHPALEKQRLPGPLPKTWAGTSSNSTPAMQETQPLFARPQPAEPLTVRSSTTRLPPVRTLILLDEVDHLSGGLRQISQERIEKAMTGEDDRPGATLKGDSGGKAELLRLLDQTKQPLFWPATKKWDSGEKFILADHKRQVHQTPVENQLRSCQ